MTYSQPFTLQDDGADADGLPPHFQARIVGTVQHRVGDGMLEPIPQTQQVQVDVAIASMVLSWVSDDQPVTVTLAREEFLEYVDIGAIRIVA